MTMYLQAKRCSYEDIDCHFVVCQKCFWTATIFSSAKKSKNMKICPICSANNISIYSISRNNT